MSYVTRGILVHKMDVGLQYCICQVNLPGGFRKRFVNAVDIIIQIKVTHVPCSHLPSEYWAYLRLCLYKPITLSANLVTFHQRGNSKKRTKKRSTAAQCWTQMPLVTDKDTQILDWIPCVIVFLLTTKLGDNIFTLLSGRWRYLAKSPIKVKGIHS